MNLPYFYQPFISKPIHVLSEETSKHCIQILRMKLHETLNITDGKGNLYTVIIIQADKKNCEVKIEAEHFNQPAKNRVSIAISLLKNSTRLEWFIEKATEIGVYEIFPLICDYTEKGNFRYERMNNILISAMLQSKQTWLPKLHQPKKMNDFINEDFNGIKLIAHCADADKTLLKNIKQDDSTLIAIGPEGDFSEAEIEAALKKDFIAVSLGLTRLRAETAGIVAATLLS